MNTVVRASIRFAIIALHRDPTLSLRRFMASAGLPSSVLSLEVDELDDVTVKQLSTAFAVPRAYWSPETSLDALRYMADCTIVPGPRFNGDVTQHVLGRVAWLEQVRRGYVGTANGFVRAAIPEPENAARSFWQTLKNGRLGLKTMEIGSQVFGVPVAYWTLTDYTDAVAVARGQKTIGVVAAA